MSLISKLQLQTIQIARRQVERASDGVFDEGQWRMTLLNVGGVRADRSGHVSSKQLDQRGFELVMAFLEERGYREPNRAADHWRTRPGVGAGEATTRQLREIVNLSTDGKYPLSAMCQRISDGAYDRPEKLTAGQAYKLIEALKAIKNRESSPTRKEVDHGDLSKEIHFGSAEPWHGTAAPANAGAATSCKEDLRRI